MPPQPAVTHLLQAASAGDPGAQQQLYELAYAELKRMAGHASRKGERRLDPTTLVHEAYLKIARGGIEQINDSRHFYSVFARAMRQVVIDLARNQGAQRHGGGLQRDSLNEGIEQSARPLDELLAIDAALSRLALADPELAELVEWHFFAGLSFVDIAQARGVTERTVRRHWDMARALLVDALGGPISPVDA